MSRNERGSVSVWVVIVAAVAFLLLVLVVDGGEVMIAKAHAADIAEQAARAAADDVDQAELQAGHVVISPDACGAGGPAAQLIANYSKGVNVTASMQNCQLIGGAGQPGVEVWVQVQMTPAIPANLFGAISVSTHENAFLKCGTANQVSRTC
jgi:uncharacterized membrane protein